MNPLIMVALAAAAFLLAREDKTNEDVPTVRSGGDGGDLDRVQRQRRTQRDRRGGINESTSESIADQSGDRAGDDSDSEQNPAEGDRETERLNADGPHELETDENEENDHAKHENGPDSGSDDDGDNVSS